MSPSILHISNWLTFFEPWYRLSGTFNTEYKATSIKKQTIWTSKKNIHDRRNNPPPKKNPKHRKKKVKREKIPHNLSTHFPFQLVVMGTHQWPILAHSLPATHVERRNQSQPYILNWEIPYPDPETIGLIRSGICIFRIIKLAIGLDNWISGSKFFLQP